MQKDILLSKVFWMKIILLISLSLCVWHRLLIHGTLQSHSFTFTLCLYLNDSLFHPLLLHTFSQSLAVCLSESPSLDRSASKRCVSAHQCTLTQRCHCFQSNSQPARIHIHMTLSASLSPSLCVCAFAIITAHKIDIL